MNNEQLHWRNRTEWISDPVCHLAEAEWLKYLINQHSHHHSLYVTSGTVITPNNQPIAAKAIFKYREFRPTGIIIDSAEPRLLGSLLDIYEHNNHPLRPLRPNPEYNIETKYGLELCEIKSKAGFDESEPLISVLMTLFRCLNVPVNPQLPDVIKTYWPE